MADESDNKRLVRFDFPRGASAESIARALNEYRRRVLDEAAERKQAAEREAAEQTLPDASPSQSPDEAEGRLPGQPGAET